MFAQQRERAERRSSVRFERCWPRNRFMVARPPQRMSCSRRVLTTLFARYTIAKIEVRNQLLRLGDAHSFRFASVGPPCIP